MIMLKVVKALGDWATEDSGVAPNPILAEALYLRLQAWGDKWLPLLDPHKSPLPEYLLSA